MVKLPQVVPDPARCPLCGQPNACAIETARVSGVAQPPCWCLQASFSQALLGRVPLAEQGMACICASCARQAAGIVGDDLD